MKLTTGQARRTVQQSDLRERTLGIGDPTSADKSAGAHNARWASISLIGGFNAGVGVGGEYEFDVPHDLGSVPSTCELVEWENSSTPATHLTARPVRKDKWSHSHAVVSVCLLTGAWKGTVARFMVRGS